MDALSEYKSPVFVYLPPFSELRGGSWAVVDPLINRHGNMEMFSCESAQGGILEASGTAGIKFRKREQLATMQRLDPLIQKLTAQKAIVTDKQQLGEIERAIENRSEELSKGIFCCLKKKERGLLKTKKSVYHAVALRFCELHDTPGRMLEKGVISGIVPWKSSRTFFANRLRRRLAEARVGKHKLAVRKRTERFDAACLCF